MTSAGILGIQISGVCFGLLMAYMTLTKYKQQALTFRSFVVFMVAWVGFIFMSFFPGTLDPLIDTLQFHRRLDFFIILGFIFILTMVFYTHLNSISLNKKMEVVVRETALLNPSIPKQENQDEKDVIKAVFKNDNKM